MNKTQLTVVKVGGKIVEEEETLKRFLSDFSQIDGKKILIHGGGRSATKLANQLGIESKMVDGRRITDKQTLDIAIMVYGGLVNKNIVATLQALGVNSLGITGADMNTIESEKRPVKDIDYGYVGDVKKVNSKVLKDFLEKGITPVLAPLTHDGKGSMLNTNADTIAALTAQALVPYFEVSLIYCFEKNGVLMDENDDNSVIPSINKESYNRYLAAGIIKGGMIPKLENAFTSVDKGVREVIVTQANCIGKQMGTKIKK